MLLIFSSNRPTARATANKSFFSSLSSASAPSFRNLYTQGTRAYSFAGFVLATVVSVIHGIVIYGWKA
jgi:hypothetical protein